MNSKVFCLPVVVALTLLSVCLTGLHFKDRRLLAESDKSALEISASWNAQLTDENKRSESAETERKNLSDGWSKLFKQYREDRDKREADYNEEVERINGQRDALFKSRIKELEADLKQAYAYQRPQVPVVINNPDYARQLDTLNHQLWQQNETMIQWKEQQAMLARFGK